MGTPHGDSHVGTALVAQLQGGSPSDATHRAGMWGQSHGDSPGGSAICSTAILMGQGTSNPQVPTPVPAHPETPHSLAAPHPRCPCLSFPKATTVTIPCPLWPLTVIQVEQGDLLGAGPAAGGLQRGREMGRGEQGVWGPPGLPPSPVLTTFLRLASTTAGASVPESDPEELLSEALASSDEVSARPFLP